MEYFIRIASTFTKFNGGSAECETLYFGSTKAKGFICIYDKTAQLSKSVGNGAWRRRGSESSADSRGGVFPSNSVLSAHSSRMVRRSIRSPTLEINRYSDVTPEMIYDWRGPLNPSESE